MHYLIVLILATWRISSLFVNEDGPFGLFSFIRYGVGVKYDEHSQPYSNNVIGSLLSCVWCFSFWVGLVLTLGYSQYPNPTILVCLPFALSAGAILVNKWMQ